MYDTSLQLPSLLGTHDIHVGKEIPYTYGLKEFSHDWPLNLYVALNVDTVYCHIHKYFSWPTSAYHNSFTTLHIINSK